MSQSPGRRPNPAPAGRDSARDHVAVAAMVQVRVQTRMVGDDGRVLRMARYMDLHYDPDEPYAVRLHDSCSAGDLVFARELLTAALRNGSAGDGDVQLYLTHQGCSLLILKRADAGALALKPQALEAFLARSFALVPSGQETAHLDLDAAIGRLLGKAA